MTFESFVKMATTLTWKKLAILTVFGAVSIAGITLYENRQKAYESVSYISNFKGDLVMNDPTPAGVIILRSIFKTHPEVAAVALVDADPLSNTRRPIHFEFNDPTIEIEMTKVLKDNPDQTSPLFTNNPSNNSQIMAVMSGEFLCAPANEGNFARLFPDAAKRLSFTCRVPLPPAYGQATGWISLHIKGKLPDEVDILKFDALNMAVAYYNADIAKRGVKVIGEPR